MTNIRSITAKWALPLLIATFVCFRVAVAADKVSPYKPTGQDITAPTAAKSESQEKGSSSSRWITITPVAKPVTSSGSKDKGSVTFTSSCTDASGKVFQKDETGYDICMQQASIDSKSRQTKGAENSGDDKSKAAAGAGFQVKFAK